MAFCPTRPEKRLSREKATEKVLAGARGPFRVSFAPLDGASCLIRSTFAHRMAIAPPGIPLPRKSHKPSAPGRRGRREGVSPSDRPKAVALLLPPHTRDPLYRRQIRAKRGPGRDPAFHTVANIAPLSACLPTHCRAAPGRARRLSRRKSRGRRGRLAPCHALSACLPRRGRGFRPRVHPSPPERLRREI